MREIERERLGARKNEGAIDKIEKLDRKKMKMQIVAEANKRRERNGTGK